MALGPFNVVVNGTGLELAGLAWWPWNAVPYSSSNAAIIDGLGLLTFGFVWNANNSWAPCNTVQVVAWAGCTGCPGPC